MSVTLAQIREGIASNLKTTLGASTVQVSAYMLENPTPPTIQVMGPDTIEYDQAMAGGLHIWNMIVQGFVGAVTDIGAQVNLDLWLAPNGTTSVMAAIESDRTLGGLVMDCSVGQASGYKIYSLPSEPAVLGCEWTVQVYTHD